MSLTHAVGGSGSLRAPVAAYKRPPAQINSFTPVHSQLDSRQKPIGIAPPPQPRGKLLAHPGPRSKSSQLCATGRDAASPVTVEG
jgi:hypothetical protein